MTLFRSLALLAPCLLLAGCSGDAQTGTVSGMVKVDGQPLAEGTISFNPVDGNSPTSGGNIINGSYSVSNVPAVAQKVIISAPKVTGSRPAYPNDPNSPQIKTTAETLPKKYSDPLQTELTLDVKAGNNAQDYSLSTMP
jgi:hypothetical protein